MTAKQFRWFLTITIVVSVLVTAIYLRYSYMGPHARYDIRKDEYQVMVPGGDWVEETIEKKRNVDSQCLKVNTVSSKPLSSLSP